MAQALLSQASISVSPSRYRFLPQPGMVLPKLLCLHLLVWLQPVACQQQMTKRAISDEKVLNGMAEPAVEPSQMQWHSASWPFEVWHGEKLIVAQVAADRLKSWIRAR